MAKPVLGKSVRSDWFFLCPDLQYRPLPWKQSKPFIFVLEQSWQIQTLQPKLRKKNVNIVILHSKIKGNFTKISKIDEEDEHSPSEFYYPEDRETFDAETETGITKSRKAIDDFINQQKSANTNKRTATDMNTILCYMEAICMKNEKIESLPASELDHLLSKFCLHTCKKYGEEYQPATVSSFQRSIQRYLSEPYCKTWRISRTPSLENQIWEKKLKRDP